MDIIERMKEICRLVEDYPEVTPEESLKRLLNDVIDYVTPAPMSPQTNDFDEGWNAAVIDMDSAKAGLGL